MTIAFQTKSAVADNSGSSLTINKPSGVAENDLMIADLGLGANMVVTPPSGWTEIVESDEGSTRCYQFYKIAGASEPSTYQWTFNSSSKSIGWISRYSGNFPANPIDVYGIDDAGSGTSATCPSITPTETPTMLHATTSSDSNSHQTDAGYPSGYTGIHSDNEGGSGGIGLGAAYKAYTGTSATGTAVFTLSSSDDWAAIHTAIYEEASGATTYTKTLGVKGYVQEQNKLKTLSAKGYVQQQGLTATFDVKGYVQQQLLTLTLSVKNYVKELGKTTGIDVSGYVKELDKALTLGVQGHVIDAAKTVATVIQGYVQEQGKTLGAEVQGYVQETLTKVAQVQTYVQEQGKTASLNVQAQVILMGMLTAAVGAYVKVFDNLLTIQVKGSITTAAGIWLPDVPLSTGLWTEDTV